MFNLAYCLYLHRRKIRSTTRLNKNFNADRLDRKRKIIYSRTNKTIKISINFKPMNNKKIEIIDLETAMALLGCTRANIYGYYLKKKILSPVPRVGKKAFFYYDEVSKILNEKLADIAARKNLKLSKRRMSNSSLITQEFLDAYTELTHKE